MHKAYSGVAISGHSRASVYKLTFSNLIKKLGLRSSQEVTRRKLRLGAANATTGWYAITYDPETISMHMASRGSRGYYQAAGTWSQADYIGLTQDVVDLGDQIKDANLNYYEVMSIRKVYDGDSFSHRVCELKTIPLYEE